MEDTFDHIYANISFFGKDNALHKVIKRLSLDKNTTLYIGDEIHDILAGRDNDISVCSVTWGFQSKEILEKSEPKFIANDVDSLKQIISNYFA